MKKNKKVIAIIITIIIMLICILYAIRSIIVKSADTYIIKQGTITEEEDAIGYIIREEEIIEEENYQNGIYAIAAEGKRVAKGESVFRYYSDNEKELNEKIAELDYQIQQQIEQEGNIPSADIKSINNQTEEKLLKIKTLTNFQEILESKQSIDLLISKKIQFIGNATENKQIKSLIKQRTEYENQLKNGSEQQTAIRSGIVSYRVDGLEGQLSVDKIDLMTEEYLEGMELRTGQIISSSNESAKIIDNFKCYIAIIMDSKKAECAQIGDIATLRIADKDEIRAELTQINEQSGKRTLIFKLNKITDDLINHRKIDIEVIWWSEEGLKVPNNAITEENGKYYVTRTKAGIETKILVKLKGSAEKFSIITSYSEGELQELGYSEEEIKQYKRITNYDEIIINNN